MAEITNSNGNTNGTPKKQLILNAFVESCSGHQSPGLWQHPDDESSKFNDLDHWIDLAKRLEEAKIHGIFIADVLGGYDVFNGPRNLEAAIRSGAQWPVNEPLVCVMPSLQHIAVANVYRPWCRQWLPLQRASASV